MQFNVKQQLFAYMAVALCMLCSGLDFVGAQDSNIVERIVFRGQSRAVFRKRLERELELLISKLNDVCGLSESQMAKLRLAGTVDIERFLREGERLKHEFDETQLNNARENVVQLLATLTPLRDRIEAGFFVDSSLFAKTLFSVLSPAQLQAPEQRSVLSRPFAVRSLTMNLRQVVPSERSKDERLKQRTAAGDRLPAGAIVLPNPQ